MRVIIFIDCGLAAAKALEHQWSDCWFALGCAAALGALLASLKKGGA